MSKGKCTHITPMVFVKSLDKALEFYTGILGFEAGIKLDDYAFIVRDDISIRLIADTDGGSEASSQSCYVCVDGIDDLYQEMKAGLDGLPEGRVKVPFDQPYGQREFHVTDEDGLLIFFGERIED